MKRCLTNLETNASDQRAKLRLSMDASSGAAKCPSGDERNDGEDAARSAAVDEAREKAGGIWSAPSSLRHAGQAE